MTNWRELGEVPDSEDDDDFGLHEPSTDLPLPTAQRGADIWEFLGSQEDEPLRSGAQETGLSVQLPTSASSPLSSPPSAQDLSPISSLVLDRGTFENGLSSELGRNSQPIAQLPPSSHSGLCGGHIDSSVPAQASQGQNGSDNEARQAAIRYERSLRPRKPIQEHPYLLENARYSNILKKHGVKPLRAAIQVTASGRDGSLPDGEFEEPSQHSSAQYARISESEPNSLGDRLGGFDELAFPSSSPPKASPMVELAQNSTPVSSQGETDNTSVPDQDLPALEELLGRPRRLESRKDASKRDATQPPSKIRKRRRLNVVDSGPVDLDAMPLTRPSFPRASPIVVDHAPPFDFLPSPTLLPSKKVIDVSSEDEGERARTPKIITNQDTLSQESHSESDTDLVNELGHRIRGVLPASWLRLDQLSGREKAQRDAKRQRRYHSMERESRRGVAQKRQALPGAIAGPLLFDDSSDNDAPDRSDEVNHRSPQQTRLRLDPASRPDRREETVLDDEESVVEDDQIDHMLPGRPVKSRQLKLPSSIRGSRKRPSAVKDPTGRRRHKARVASQSEKHRNSSLSEKPLSTGRASDAQWRLSKTNRTKRATPRKPRPPRLSILDIIGPGAPRFLKIAARAAEKRRDKGRCSPWEKTIHLATRKDHIDAVSVLHHWRAGSIPQRASVTAASTAAQKACSALPLADASGNRSAPEPSQRFPPSSTRKLVKHVTNGGSVSYRRSGGPLKGRSEQPGRGGGSTLQPCLGLIRPAQLEQEQDSRMTNAAFHARKRHLDRLYRDRHLKMPLIASAIGSVEDIGTPLKPAISASKMLTEQSSRKVGFRKRTRPRHVDLEAPQYSHANDPLPPQYSPENEPIRAGSGGGKVLGLGPYGTVYTHHFEAFPLDSRVYFHESTLIGSGVIESCLSGGFWERMLSTRSRASFRLGGQSLNWGLFDAQVSSELGVVLDFVAEHIESGSPAEGDSADSSAPVAAAMLVLTYFKDSLSISGDEQAKSFVARAHECLHSFNERMKSQAQEIAQGPQRKRDVALKVYDRLLLTCLVVLKICRFGPLLGPELLRIEDCLKGLASTIISLLSGLGAAQIRRSCEDLGNPRCRERGLRGESPVIHSWVVVMKTLEIARIPRASFWELVQPVVTPPHVLSSADARDFERAWEAMFTLLPLTEFNHLGVIVPGQRHEPASDGWIIPQRLLKRVFHLYRENSRQSPSFNNYCRALVGRCHYLVQQWGWRRSVTVIGVVFDFFGSQNLAHLRNEEVYESPRFLEELARRPTLEIEPSDSCFHVFLKLIALSIQKLKGAGAVKDVRNMVARTIPNHNRQHLKEQNVLACDLAALRNHHDLLGTLFWASPPEIRPPANLIERLVAPESSHKEACLINIRSWNQLARFVVASGEAVQSFKPFIQWRNMFFQQVLRQFDSVASVVQQQVLSLAKDAGESISDEVIQATISANKATGMDVMYACAAASLDVMRHAPDLEAATFALNTLQLQSIFRQFAVAPPTLDWAVLRAALGTLDAFLSKIDAFKETEESQQSESQILNSAQADDALLLMDQDISPGFFSMARCMLSCPRSRSVSAAADLDKADCLEQVVRLSARMGARFMNAGVMGLSAMFTAGKYGFFDKRPHKLGLDQRRSLVLFLLTLLRCGWDDISNSDLSLSEVWALSLVKPREYLGYEMQLGQELCHKRKDFVPKTIEGLTVQPDYSTNRDLFEFVISTMRRWIRDAGPSLQKVLAAESSRTLKVVMEQIKGDLAVMSREASGYGSYVTFVQSIVSLIKTHGSDICAVDNFFLQISKDYFPSVQDPNLQVAGLISYGLRLREGDGRSSQQLFFLLFNNSKFAIINDKLREEVAMLRRGMKNADIVDFVLGKMLPAIVRACFQNSAAFPLLDMYAEALRLVFAKKTATHELCEDDLPLVDVLTCAAVEGLVYLSSSGTALDGPQLHAIRQSMATLNMLWPSLYAISASGTQSPGWRALEHLVQTGERTVEPARLCAGFAEAPIEGFRFDAEVRSFTENMVQDIGKSWTVTAQNISIQTPGMNRRGAVSTRGLEIPPWDAEDLVEDLDGRIKEWRWWWQRVCGDCCLVERQMSVVF